MESRRNTFFFVCLLVFNSVRQRLPSSKCIWFCVCVCVPWAAACLHTFFRHIRQLIEFLCSAAVQTASIDRSIVIFLSVYGFKTHEFGMQQNDKKKIVMIFHFAFLPINRKIICNFLRKQYLHFFRTKIKANGTRSIDWCFVYLEVFTTSPL